MTNMPSPLPSAKTDVHCSNSNQTPAVFHGASCSPPTIPEGLTEDLEELSSA